jgi:hypothetical protein
MTNLNSPILQGGIKNVNFFNGRLLTATDLRDEQAANRQQHWQLGQAAGSGVVYGLEVSLVAAKRVQVTAGLAINSQGQPLMLPDDSEITLAAEANSNDAAPDFFADCDQPPPQQTAGEMDIYALVMAPAAGYNGSAPMHTLQDEGRLNGCGKRYAVEGVKFRLVRFNREALADLSAATRTEILALLDAAEPTAAQRSRLRNLLAHLCFGTEPLAAFGREPFQRDGHESVYWRYGALDALRANGRLNPCDVPLALMHLTAAGIQMVDLWAVRRRATAVTPSAIWPTAVADRRPAEAEAIFLQFQAHLEQLGLAQSAATISAPAYFRYLPPAGLLPGAAPAINPNAFFSGYPVRQTGPFDGGRLQALLRDSYNYPPIDLDQEEPVRLYKRPSGDDEVYTLFTTVRLPPLESMADDLRHHNKHLHGWGIVCGLKVRCGPDDLGQQRRHVSVGSGYALDCEGNNLSIHGQKVVDVMAAVDRLAHEDPNNPPLQNGSGEVCLTLALDDEGRPSVDVERYTPEEKGVQSMLKGTLLMDFYEHCIVGLIEAIKTQFTPQPGEEKELVGPTHKRLITFMNLAVQLIKGEYGRYVYLSPQEDEILRNFYLLLRALLQSSTFCGMFDNARPFPDYPFAKHNIHTIFGKGFHSRLRLHPDGQLACTVGSDNKLHLYNLADEKMVAAVEMPGGEGLIVQDVAFAAGGQQLVAIGNIKDRDTILAVAEISSVDKGQLKWRPINIWCGLRLRRLATYQENAGMVYAVGSYVGEEEAEEGGLFSIDVSSDSPQPELIGEPFDPAGHLVIHQASGVAYATVRATANSDDFDHIRTRNLNDGSGRTFDIEPRGQHDLLVVDSPRDQQAYLFVVVEGNGILQLDATNGDLQTRIDLGEETVVHLGHVPGSDRLLVSLEDSFRLRRVTIARQSTLDEDYHFPLQISPLALAAAPEQARVYALNSLSMTLTSIPTAYLVEQERNEAEPPPGGQAFLNSLESYRNDIFAAFIDLLGGLLQYLKDCLCDHFLVNCPDCEEVEPIYLACVSIRDNQVHHVCNFSRRKYVKSFPTVGYWLSILPLAPFIKQAITKFCCAILPDLFGRYQTRGHKGYNVGVSGYQARQGLTFASSGAMASEIREMMGGLNLATAMAGDWSTAVLSETVSSLLGSQKQAAPELTQQEVSGQPLAQVNKKMTANNIEVVGVEKYDPSHGRENLINLSRSPLRLKAGSQVKLYEEDGVVRYAALVEEKTAVRTTETAVAAAPATAELQERLTTQQNQIEQLETELQALRLFRDEVRTFMERK